MSQPGATTHLVRNEPAPNLPALITDAGPEASRSYLEFFIASIRNPNTRVAYLTAVQNFLAWAQSKHLTLHSIDPLVVSAYIELLLATSSIATVKLQLSALCQFFGFLVMKQQMKSNPAKEVKPPRLSRTRGKTQELTSEQARAFLESIPTTDILGLRDRAVVAVMLGTFARVGAVSRMRVEDYGQLGQQRFVRLLEKGSKERVIPANVDIQRLLDAYLEAAGIRDDRKSWLFRSAPRRSLRLSSSQFAAKSIYQMIRARARDAGVTVPICCHTFRTTGITHYLQQGGSLDEAQLIAGHVSISTTKLYDRRKDEITPSMVARTVL